MKTVSPQFVKKLFPKRPPWSHKGNFGKLLVIGGNRMYSGSPTLSALSAIRSGADLVTIVAPQRPADIIASFSPDIITYPLRGDYINPWHLKEVLNLVKNADAVVIGGGLGRVIHTQNFVLKFLEKVNTPCVIDADAIHAVKLNPKILNQNHVLTPHSYEFSVLSGTKPSQDLKKRSNQVKTLAKSLGTTILLKGHVDIISNGKETLFNRTGNPYMTKGGTGDTLTGICGALLTRGITPLNAASGAAYINGKAGDLALKNIGRGFLVMELSEMITKII